jgi:hypothetical protein
VIAAPVTISAETSHATHAADVLRRDEAAERRGDLVRRHRLTEHLGVDRSGHQAVDPDRFARIGVERSVCNADREPREEC